MIRLLQNSFALAHKIFPQGGTCLEFGVHVGNTFIWEAKELQKQYQKSKLIGFDSWQGLPKEGTNLWFPQRHSQGEFAVPKDVVLHRLQRIGMANDPRIKFVDGFFADSLTKKLQQQIKNLIFVNIDVDIYKSTTELLDFIKPLLRPGVIIYWDDWKDPQDEFAGKWGEHFAWETWIAKNKDIKAETIEINPLNQRYMIITEVSKQTLSSSHLSLKKIRYDAFEISNYKGTSRLRNILRRTKHKLLKLKSQLS